MNKNLLVLLPSLALALAACERRPAAPAVGLSAPAPTPEAGPRLSLLERLELERTSRPAAHPPVEAVAAALVGKGLPLERWKQVLASPIGARFCMAGQTAQGNVVSVCEYGDEQQAARGLTYSKETFDRLIPNRTLVRRAATLLTVTRPDPALRSIDEVRAITAIFATISSAI
jgi:hypothetical protein